METRFCPGCRAAQLVEQPPCPDDHEECPEWACVVCGTAIIAGWFDSEVSRSARSA